ncbi:TasA family protein [Eubacterium maltosivorans]|uniref:TasA family protein n=1 Tax=Eubacterium maltosivorans TaxID=2041044 RepID=UPI003A945ECE
MNKKRLAKGLTAAALIGVIAVGSTLAYLSANTGQKTNKFSGGDIGGKTVEEFDREKAENYKPGDVINKQPSITIDANSVNAMVALSVDYYGDDVVTEAEGDNYIIKNADKATKLSQENFKRYGEVQGWNTGEWTLIAKSAKGSELYMLNEQMKQNEKETSTPALFESIKVNAGLRTVTETDSKTTTVYDKDKNIVEFSKVTNSIKDSYYTDANGNILILDSLPTFVIDVNGYAVQADNLADNSTTAAAELIKLANVGRSGGDVFTAVTI